jgi:hypothetical protein
MKRKEPDRKVSRNVTQTKKTSNRLESYLGKKGGSKRSDSSEDSEEQPKKSEGKKKSRD